jgi:broad specificity phosphatase PhoE
VLSSPSARALETCRLAGLSGDAHVSGDLREWDYGAYDGRTTAQIREEQPGWTIWTGVVPGGETLAEVGARADRVLAVVRSADGDVAVFSHGHFLRVLAARWVELEPSAGAVLALDPATISVLGHEHGRPVVREWNAGCEPSVPGG